MLEALNVADLQAENNAPETRPDVENLVYVTSHGLGQVVDDNAIVV